VLVAGIIGKEDLARFITQEPLVETKQSMSGISQVAEVNALFFGVGLCNGVPMLSAGLPIDILSMILTGEQIHAEKKILVADTHAISNGFDAAPTDRLAQQYQEVLQRTLENLGFDRWEIIRASAIDQTTQYMDLLQTIDAQNEYVKRELTDMCWFSQQHNVNLKLGWVLNGSKNSDEKSFDQQFQQQFSDNLGFIYVSPGRTFNPNRIRSAPYFCTNPEERIMLQPNEDPRQKIISAKEKFGSKATRAYEKYLNQVIRLYDKTVERTERGDVASRLQQVIERCTR